MRRIALALSAAAATFFNGQALAQELKVGPADLAIVMSTYVDGIVELKQFLKACAQRQPSNWDQGVSLLLASVRSAGLGEPGASDLARRLSLTPIAEAGYDCTGDVARHRLDLGHPADWIEYHKRLLGDLGIAPVVPPTENDPRLTAARKAVEGHIAEQSELLACMALVEPQWFAIAYVDWNQALDDAAAAIRSAGYAYEDGERVVGPARSANLMTSVEDRQAAIGACIADTKWMDRYSTFNWYLVIGEVKKAVGVAN